LIAATPLASFLGGGSSRTDPPDWQSSFYGGQTPQVVAVTGNQTARANITVPDGPAAVSVDWANCGSMDFSFICLIPSGVTSDVEVYGTGFTDAIQPENIVIYGPGISVGVGSVKVTGPSVLSFSVDVQPQTDWGDAVIAIRREGALAIYSGVRTMPQGPQIVPSGVRNAASFVSGAVAPGEIVSIFGSGLGPDTPLIGKLDDSGWLPRTLGDTAVDFDGQPAPLFYVASGQINAQVPFEAGSRTSTRIHLRYRDSGSEVIMPIAPGSPAIFGDPVRPAVVNEDGSLNDPSHPARRGSVVVVYGTGQGVVDPPLETGAAAPAKPLSLAAGLTASIAGLPAAVEFAGMTPGFVGLLQVNLVVPKETPVGMVALTLAVNDTVGSNGAHIWVQ
jgi:uncharacterized protein (TIGR03437 family)